MRDTWERHIDIFPIMRMSDFELPEVMTIDEQLEYLRQQGLLQGDSNARDGQLGSPGSSESATLHGSPVTFPKASFFLL